MPQVGGKPSNSLKTFDEFEERGNYHRSIMTKPCTLIKNELMSTDKSPAMTSDQWLCKVHIDDQVRTRPFLYHSIIV